VYASGIVVSVAKPFAEQEGNVVGTDVEGVGTLKSVLCVLLETRVPKRIDIAVIVINLKIAPVLAEKLEFEAQLSKRTRNDLDIESNSDIDMVSVIYPGIDEILAKPPPRSGADTSAFSGGNCRPLVPNVEIERFGCLFTRTTWKTARPRALGAVLTIRTGNAVLAIAIMSCITGSAFDVVVARGKVHIGFNADLWIDPDVVLAAVIIGGTSRMVHLHIIFSASRTRSAPLIARKRIRS